MQITIAYGMTETSPVSCHSLTDTPLAKRVLTFSQVHPHLKFKLVDPESGDIVPICITGELCTRGYAVIQGYWDWDDLAKTQEADGWMHTGDLAMMNRVKATSISSDE